MMCKKCSRAHKAQAAGISTENEVRALFVSAVDAEQHWRPQHALDALGWLVSLVSPIRAAAGFIIAARATVIGVIFSRIGRDANLAIERFQNRRVRRCAECGEPR